MKFLPLSLQRWVNSLLIRLLKRSREGEQLQQAAYELAAEEEISRFVYSSSHFSRANNRLKQGAFSPEPHSELSVLHSIGLSSTEIWRYGVLTLGAQPGRSKIYGRADLAVAKVIAQKLRAIRDDIPFGRHTNVVGWPHSRDPDQQKADIKAICLELSQDPDVRVILPQNPITKTSELV
jgi:hypothetical protein